VGATPKEIQSVYYCIFAINGCIVGKTKPNLSILSMLDAVRPASHLGIAALAEEPNERVS
jgi:hypothetical protein